MLLQSRPNRLRAKGPITRARLQLLRECKTLQSAERIRKANLITASDIASSERYASESSEPLSSSTIEPSVNSWLDFDFGGISTASQSPFLQSGSSPLEDSLGPKHFEPIDFQPALRPWKTEKAESTLGLYEIDSVPMGPGQYEPIIIQTGSGSDDWITSKLSDESVLGKIEPGYVDVQSAIEDRERILSPRNAQVVDSTSEECKRTFSMPEDITTPSTIKPDAHDTRSILSVGNSTRSVMSLRSLKKRLQSKYSTSFLGDIKSLMERLTISESSEISSTMTGRTSSSKTQSRISVPTRMDHPVILPGSFPQYCWEHINHNELRRCDDVKSPCNCGPIFQLIGLETHRSIRSDVLFRIRACSVRPDDLEDVDTFNNSVLHIAAALEAPPDYLSHLISMGADVHALNNANQTFLHLTHVSSVERIPDFHILIGSLVRRQFNFQRQDFNGQTAIHALTEPPVSSDILNGFVQAFQFYAIELPNSRDNLGYKIRDQLQEMESKSTLSVIEDPRFSLDREFFSGQRDANNDGQFEDLSFVNRSFQNFRKHDWIENLEDLQQYELHADLLRTIVSAGENPLYEDADGRNGLHCLAEVRLDLPIPGKLSDRKSASDLQFSTTSRERYLEQLVVAGVDPNSHDKQGITPFMAFIMHRREGEDDDLTTKIFQRLFDAGADVHRRNRHGETPLHIAVRLGNRAATNFLLSHGANVHARTSNGTGIMTLGLKHSSSSKAAQDEILYAQISLCTCLVGSAGAVSAPTILHEWGSPSFRIRPDRTFPNTGHETTSQRKNLRIPYFK
jgi:ankyrin repeat protein